MSIILKCYECGHLYPAHEEPGSCMADGCDCKLDRVAVLLDCIAALEAERAKLRAALGMISKTRYRTDAIYTLDTVYGIVDRALLAQEPA